MKKEAKKHDLVKIAGIMVLISVLLTWLIPQGMFQNGSLSVGDITRVGIFDFFTYGLLGMYYFTVLVTFLFVLGGFYQVLSKTGGYQKLTDKIAKTFKGKEILFALVVSFILAALSSVTNEYILLISAAPLIITIARKMHLDKLTAFNITFGSILIGVLGSIYSPKVVGLSVSYLTTDYNTLMWAKLVIFALSFLAYNTFTVLHLIKTKKSSKKDEQIEELFVSEETTVKTKVWPLVVVLSIFFVVAILAYLPWESVFKITWFTKATESITTFKILDEPIFGYILGSSLLAFGKWDIFGIQVLMLITTLVIKWIYKIKFDEFLEAYGEGFKKVGKLVVLLLLCYLVLEFAVMFPVLPTIVDWIVGLSSKFNVLLSTISGLLSSMFTVEYQYTANLIGTYLVSTFADYKEQIALMLQSTFGLASMFTPSSAILLVGLGYLGITYKEWMKYIWKFLLIMFAVIIIIMLIIC